MSLPNDIPFDKDSSYNLAKEPKPETQIRINVKGLDNTLVQFKIQKHVAMGKLMKKYCERKGLAPENIRFLFDNTRIQKDSTPLSMGIEDDDTLDIVSKQDGGGKDSAYSLSSMKEREGSAPININVQGVDNSIIQFTVKKHMKLSKLMEKYCEKKNLVPDNTRFLFDGKQVQNGDTPKSMGIDDGDTFEVFTKQGAKKTITNPSPDNEKPQENKISINVCGTDNTIVQFNIMKHVQFSKMMESYCKKMKLDSSLIRFLYDGERIYGDYTPESKDIEDGATIEVRSKQVSGSSLT